MSNNFKTKFRCICEELVDQASDARQALDGIETKDFETASHEEVSRVLRNLSAATDQVRCAAEYLERLLLLGLGEDEPAAEVTG